MLRARPLCWAALLGACCWAPAAVPADEPPPEPVKKLSKEDVEKAEKAVRQRGQYTLERKLGSGGMGSVYRARHAFLRRPTAVKMINADNVSPVSLARFEREVQLTSRLCHHNTIAVYDYGKTPDGVFYYAMEYLEGINMEDLVKQGGPLPEARIVQALSR